MLEGLADQAQEAVERARALGANEVAARVGQARSTSYSMRDGELEKVQESASSSLSVSLYVDGRYSAHSTSDLAPDRLELFLREAVELTKALEPDPHRHLADPALYPGPELRELDLVDEELRELDRERATSWLLELNTTARDDARCISVTSNLGSGHSASARCHSNGFAGTEESTGLGYGSSVTLRDAGDRRPEAGCYRGARHQEDIPRPAEVGREALRRAAARLGSSKAPTTRARVVIEAEAADRLVGPMLSALTARAVQQKRSFLADRQGQRVAATCLSVRDEPLLSRGLGSRQYDGEGLAARSLSLIEDGVVRGYYSDTYYASKLGWKATTGSSSNIVVTPGERSCDGLIESCGEGFLVTGWLGGNENGTTGDFSYGFQGHRITGGVRSEAVGEMNLTGNFLELFEGLAEVGNDPAPSSALLVPSLVFEGVELSGS